MMIIKHLSTGCHYWQCKDSAEAIFHKHKQQCYGMWRGWANTHDVQMQAS